MGLSIGFRYLISLLPAIQATGRLAVALAGLPPAEHASLRWTHETAFYAVFHRIHALFALASFEFGRTDLTERRMSSPVVIEHFDVIEQLHLGFTAAREAIGGLALHAREETLHHRVVVTIAATAHAAGDPVRLQDGLIILAGVRAALVGVMEQPHVRTPPLQRPDEGSDRQ